MSVHGVSITEFLYVDVRTVVQIFPYSMRYVGRAL